MEDTKTGRVAVEQAIQTDNKTYSNPFPGLRPFGMDESHLFFGREGQSDEVLRKLSENKFCAVIGASGSGKSSFIYCGVIPILYGGFLTKIGTNWDVIVTRPGAGPFDNLASSILKKDKEYKLLDADDKQIKKTIISTLLKSSSLGLIEAVSQFTNTENKNILLIVDQFEELFRFKKNEESNGLSESLAYVNLLVQTIETLNAPIYVAITMRSDFIGDCAQFPQLTKLINQSNYLIPQMTREQKRAAIVGPISVAGGKISSRLLQQVLSDLGDNTDQLPILAHSLMRTFDYWVENHDLSEPLDLQHYEAIGTMSGALSQHANEAYDELDSRQKDICASIFKCITEKSGDSDGIRRPTKVSTIAQIANCDAEEVINVVEVFRKPGRSLLMPAVGTRLKNDSVIDISHESLMRIWVRLKNWVDEEGQAVEMYLRLSDASAKYQTGKSGMWRPPDLQLALNWQEKNNPTLVWGQRYNPAYERTMVFLETSKKAFETEQKVKEEMQKKRLRQSKLVAIIMSIFAIFAIVALVFSYMQKLEADKQTELAKIQKVEADKQKTIAIQKEKDALKAQQLAQVKEKEAIISAEEAKKQAELARLSAEEANKQKAIAQRSEQLAKQQSKIAQEQRLLALASEQKAMEQSKLAELSATDARKQRLLSIAQAMAVKSLGIYDTTTRALVAQQAYQFNKMFDGNPHNHDIYDALYYANKHLFHDSYNNLKGHSDAVRSVAFNSDGKEMYTTGSDGKILKWIKQGNKLTSVKFHQNLFINRILKISSDDKYMAVAGEEPYIQLFDLKNPGAVPIKLFGHKSKIGSMAFTPDNQNIVTVGEDSAIILRNLETKKYYTVAKIGSKIKAIAISPDGQFVAGGDENGKVYLWGTSGGTQMYDLKIKNMKKILSLTYSYDGKFLAIGDESGNIKVWDAIKNVPFANPSGHRARINDLKFDYQNKVLASASFDGSVRLWDLEHLNESPIVLRDHNSWVWSVAFSPDGSRIVTGCVDNLIRSYPTNIDEMAEKICPELKRNMTPDEWKLYVAKDVKYEQTCNGLPEGKNKEIE